MENNIYITGEINDKSLNDLKSQLKQISYGKTNIINVHIDSEGGYVVSGKMMMILLEKEKQKGMKINTFGYSMVYSAATYPFMCGENRILHESSEFLVHPPIGAIEGNPKEMKSYISEMIDVENFIIDLYCKKTKRNKEKIKNLIYQNRIITGNEALQWGFATAIDKTLNIVKKEKKIKNYYKQKKVVMKKNAMTMLQSMQVLLGKRTKFNVLIENAKKRSIKNMLLSTSDGQKLYAYSESIEDLQGSIIVLADEEGSPTETPAPDGDYYLDNIVITVVSGIIEEVKDKEEVDIETENSEEETLEDVKNSISLLAKELKNVLKRLNKIENVTNALTNLETNGEKMNIQHTETQNTGYKSSLPDFIK
jgi:ATP-dependent protease ClpP protease subunit